MRYQIEIPLMLFFFATTLSSSILSNLIIFRTCYVTFGFNRSECALLGTKHTDNATHHLEQIVQPYVTNINLASMLLTSVFSIWLCLTLGPWSDKYGRRPVLLLAQFGMVLGQVMTAFVSLLEYWSPWWFILGNVSVLFGGYAVFVSAILCYITDTTEEDNRGVRLAIMSGALYFSLTLGTALSSYVYDLLGYTLLFLLCATIIACGFFYTYVVIQESVSHTQTEGRFRSLFDCNHAYTLFKTLIKRRESYKRVTLILLIMMTAISAITSFDGSFVVLMLREKFGWSMQKYTLFNSITGVIGVIGGFLGIVVLHKWLKIPETILILIAYISGLDQALVYALANKDWEIYFGGFVKCLNGCASPMVQSLLSKLGFSEEMGKVFSLMMVMETIAVPLSTVFYTAVYKATVQSNASTFNYVTAGCQSILIICSFIILYLRTRHNNSETPICDDDTSIIDVHL